MENKSYRGMLVKVIVKSFRERYLFDMTDNLKEILQERLDLNLKFETNVSDLKNRIIVQKEHFDGYDIVTNAHHVETLDCQPKLNY